MDDLPFHEVTTTDNWTRYKDFMKWTVIEDVKTSEEYL